MEGGEGLKVAAMKGKDNVMGGTINIVEYLVRLQGDVEGGANSNETTFERASEDVK